jgi:hypothetical protein
MSKSPSTAEMNPRFALRTLFITFSVAAICLTPISVGWRYMSERREVRRELIARYKLEDERTLRELVPEIDTVVRRTGHLPRHEVELEMLLGHPLPDLHHETRVCPLEFTRTTATAYRVLCLRGWTYYCYESDNPGAGWVTQPF